MTSEPKLHHYVPRFYLKVFSSPTEKLWVWDKAERKVYQSSPNGVAAQTYFYRVPEFIGSDVDPLFLEKDLARLEAEAAVVLAACVATLDTLKFPERLELSGDNRWLISTFLAVQFLRTAEQREILSLYAEGSGLYKKEIDSNERANLHAQMLCSGGLVESLRDQIHGCIWMYARNDTTIPFWTSDNPVCFKTGDNRIWLKAVGIFSPGAYLVFPLSPKYVLYCKEPEHWKALQKWDSILSPVELTDEMVLHENGGQVFMATRHVISPVGEFAWANEFADTISTDGQAPGQEDDVS